MPKYQNQLISDWLPKLPGIVPKLQSAAKVADVGCSSGLTTLLMAEAFPGNNCDLICYFDCLHDLGDPTGACAYAKSVLHPDGCLILVEPTAEDRLEENFGDINAISYAMSTCICTPTSLSQEIGLVLGAQAGPARLRQVVQEVGFNNFNIVYKTMSHMVIHVS